MTKELINEILENIGLELIDNGSDADDHDKCSQKLPE